MIYEITYAYDYGCRFCCSILCASLKDAIRRFWNQKFSSGRFFNYKEHIHIINIEVRSDYSYRSYYFGTDNMEATAYPNDLNISSTIDINNIVAYFDTSSININTGTNSLQNLEPVYSDDRISWRRENVYV